MKTVIVIGGTKGVGKQIVIECIRREYNVIFTGTDENAASELLNLVNSALDLTLCRYPTQL